MKCPFCSSCQTNVLESRASDNDTSVRRRRDCVECERRFTTYERVERHPLLVVKKNDRRETFDRDKLRSGILNACHKRPVSAEQIDDLVEQVEAELRCAGTQEVGSEIIGKTVLKHLKPIDKVAWIRFASVYLAFDTLNDFESTIETEL